MDLSRSRKRSRSNMVPSLGNRVLLASSVARRSPAPCCRDLLRRRLDGRSCHRLVATRTANADAFYQCVKGLRQQFIADHLPAGSDGQVRSVAGRFGVVAAAGELATEWGILPWEIGEATQAAAICFQAWLDRARRHRCW